MARRVNTKFVGIFAAIVVVLVGGLFVARKVLIRQHPEEFVAAAHEAERNHQWDEAVKDWNKALRISSQDPALWNELGKAYHELGITSVEVDKERLDRGAWEQALEIDPNFTPAVRSLVAYWREQMRTNPGVEPFRQARQRAAQFLSLAPNDPDAADIQAFLYTMTIQGYMGGLDPNITSIDDTEQKMRALMVQQPSNADMMFYLGLLDAHRAQALVRGDSDMEQPASATRLFKKAVTDVQNSLKGQDANAAMHYRAAQIYTVLSQEDHSTSDNQDKYQKLADAQMDKAVSLVTGNDPRFVEVMLAAASQSFLSGQSAKGKDILRRFLLEEANDPMAIVRAMPLLRQNPDQRDQAIAMLETALSGGPKTAEINTRQFAMLDAVVSLRISKLAEIVDHAIALTGNSQPGDSPVPDDAATKTLVSNINRDVQRMSDANMDPVRVLREKALLALTEHDNITAIQVLNQGMSNPLVAADPEMNWQLTQAYAAVNERAMATDACKKVIAANAGFLPARKMLVRLLTGQPTEEARRTIDQSLTYLEHAAPHDPEVIRLEMSQLDPDKDGAKVKELYDQLPETTPRELLAKAIVAMETLKDINESARVLNKAMDLNPDDVPTVMGLARVLAAQGRNTQAQVAIQRGLAAHPDDKSLQFILKQLQQASPADLLKLQNEILAQNVNPVEKQVQLATDALVKKDFESAEKYLKAADAINPNNKDVLDRYFRLYTETHQWDKLDPIIKKLGEINYDQAHGELYQFEAAKAKGDADRQLQIALQLTSELPEFAMSYYCLGQAYQAKHQYRQAIENYETAMQKKGIVKDAAVMLKAEIQCDYEMNRPEVALAAIQEGRRRFVDDPEFQMMEIHHEMAHGQAEAAVAQLQDMLAANPNVPDIYLDLAGAQMQIALTKLAIPDAQAAGQAAIAARDVLRGAIQKFPDEARLYERLSEVLRFGGDYQDAEQVLKQLDARPAWSDDAEAQDKLGQFYTAMDQNQKAQAAFVEAIRRAKAAQKPGIAVRYAALLSKMGKYDEALAILVQSGPDDYEVGRQRANVLVQAGRYAEAEDVLKTLLSHNPPDPSLLHVAWAELELNTGKRASAMEHVATALQLDPHSIPGLVMRAQLKMEQQPPDWEGALQDLNVARLMKPDDMQMLTSLCDVYLYRLQADQAAQVLETALHNDPTNTAVRFRLAYVLANYQPVQLDQALHVLQEGLHLPGGERNGDLYNDLANVYEQKGDPAAALSTVADALNHLPGNPTLIRSYLRLLLRNKQYPTAISAAATVLKGRPDVWWAMQFKGQAEAALGDKGSGLKDLTAALTAAEAQHDITDAAGVVAIIAHDIDSLVAVNMVRQRVAGDPQWEFTLILLEHQRGDDAAAVAELEPFLAAAKDLPQQQKRARLQLAGVVYSGAQPKPYGQKAYDVYKEMLATTPDDVAVLNNFACVCADDFTPPKAEDGLAAIRKAMAIMNSRGASDPFVEDTYGWLMILSGQTTDGMEVLRKALSRDPFADGYYHMGEGYLRMNRPQDAQQQVNLALDAVTKAEQSDKPVSPSLRAKIEDLSNRVLDSLRTRTSGSLP